MIADRFFRAAAVLLFALATCPSVSRATTVSIQTVMGPIDILLYDTAAPGAVANFLKNVNAGTYGNSIIHYGVPGVGVFGGRSAWDEAQRKVAGIPQLPPISTQGDAVQVNNRGKIAMYGAPGASNIANRASEWFINLGDIARSGVGPNTVFGEVVASSMLTLDAIAALPRSVPEQYLLFATPGAQGLQKSHLVTVNSATIAPPSYQGLWWNAAESGWGMSITQHGGRAFAAIYTYDDAGQPTWYVMPACAVATDRCTSDIYKVTGGTPPDARWNGTSKTVGKVGSGVLTFTSASTGRFDFIINNIAGSKAITLQTFASGTTAPETDNTDMWWNANESGWGLSVIQQFNTIFAAWYAYDASGKAAWYVMPNCPLHGTFCTGALYRVQGGAPLTANWKGASPATAVGSSTLLFDVNVGGVFHYTIDGFSSSRYIVRQPF